MYMDFTYLLLLLLLLFPRPPLLKECTGHPASAEICNSLKMSRGKTRNETTVDHRFETCEFLLVISYGYHGNCRHIV